MKTNPNPATTILYPVIFHFYTLTNQTVVPFTGELVAFHSGIVASNSGPGPVTIIDVTTNAP